MIYKMSLAAGKGLESSAVVKRIAVSVPHMYFCADILELEAPWLLKHADFMHKAAWAVAERLLDALLKYRQDFGTIGDLLIAIIQSAHGGIVHASEVVSYEPGYRAQCDCERAWRRTCGSKKHANGANVGERSRTQTADKRNGREPFGDLCSTGGCMRSATRKSNDSKPLHA